MNTPTSATTAEGPEKTDRRIRKTKRFPVDGDEGVEKGVDCGGDARRCQRRTGNRACINDGAASGSSAVDSGEARRGGPRRGVRKASGEDCSEAERDQDRDDRLACGRKDQPAEKIGQKEGDRSPRCASSNSRSRSGGPRTAPANRQAATCGVQTTDRSSETPSTMP